MIVTTEHTYAPLDEAAMKQALILVKSFCCARPVIYEGHERFITYIGIGAKGGGIEVMAYLSGMTASVDGSAISIAP